MPPSDIHGPPFLPKKPVPSPNGETVTNSQYVLETINCCYCESIFVDRVAGEIIRLVASVCMSVRLSVCVYVCVRLLWALSCLNRLTFDLDFWHEGRP